MLYPLFLPSPNLGMLPIHQTCVWVYVFFFLHFFNEQVKERIHSQVWWGIIFKSLQNGENEKTGEDGRSGWHKDRCVCVFHNQNNLAPLTCQPQTEKWRWKNTAVSKPPPSPAAAGFESCLFHSAHASILILQWRRNPFSYWRDGRGSISETRLVQYPFLHLPKNNNIGLECQSERAGNIFANTSFGEKCCVRLKWNFDAISR